MIDAPPNRIGPNHMGHNYLVSEGAAAGPASINTYAQAHTVWGSRRVRRPAFRVLTFLGGRDQTTRSAGRSISGTGKLRGQFGAWTESASEAGPLGPQQFSERY